MKKIYFTAFNASPLAISLPIFWAGMKRYYELNGQHADQWEWIPPIIDYNEWTVDQICQEAIEHRADVYAFSSYLWNWNLIKEVTKQIRKALPNTLIVLGGPHQGTTYTDPIFWFKKNPQFDATCRPTEYGELFITDMLDTVATGSLNWASVTSSYHRKGQGPAADKKAFIFPRDVFSSNLDVLLEFSQYAQKHGRQLNLWYETTRGCPYGCTYCEWGGGTNSKVVAKPIEVIQDDLIYLPMLKVNSFYLCDANFGILPRDPKLAKLFASFKGIGIDHLHIMGLAKTSTSKRRAVLEPLFKSQVLKHYFMSVQSTNPQVLEIIDRKDISVDDNIKLGRYFIDKYNANVNVELILGMPGSTLEDYYRDITYFYTDFSVVKYFITVLPDSPYADPKYIEQWKIKLVPVGLETEAVDNTYYAAYDKKLALEPFTFLSVATHSFDEEDWKEISFMSDMELLLINRHLLKPFTDYMIKNKGFEAGYVLKKVFVALSKVDKFYQPIYRYLTDVVKGKYSNDDFKQLNGEHVINAYYRLWVENYKAIFASLEELFIDDLDLQALDCLIYTANSTLRTDKDIEWISHWNWPAWEEGEQRGLEPVKEIICLKTFAKKFTPSLEIDRADNTVIVTGNKFVPVKLPKFSLYVTNSTINRAFS